MNRYLILLLCLVLAAGGASAADGQQEQKCFKKGTFVSLEFSFVPVLNERIAGAQANSSYGTDVSVGYRFSPQIAVAVGTGAHAIRTRPGPVTIRCLEGLRIHVCRSFCV